MYSVSNQRIVSSPSWLNVVLIVVVHAISASCVSIQLSVLIVETIVMARASWLNLSGLIVFVDYLRSLHGP